MTVLSPHIGLRRRQGRRSQNPAHTRRRGGGTAPLQRAGPNPPAANHVTLDFDAYRLGKMRIRVA